MNQESRITAVEPAAAPAAATVEIESRRAMREVESAIITAKRFPRDMVAALDRILQACRRPVLAENAIYAYPRGGQIVTGPSIRLAEALAQSWGNVQFGIRELSQQAGESTVEAFAWDVETNTRALKVFQVPHVRYTKERGNVRLTDPRDIYEMIANQGTRRMRACILAIIPGDVIEAALKECDKTQEHALGAKEDVLKRVIEVFRTVGVSKEQIERRLGHRLDQSTVNAEILALKRIYTALKDGQAKPEDYFPPMRGAGDQGKSAKDTLRGFVAGLRGDKREQPKEAQAAGPPEGGGSEGPEADIY